MPDLIQFFIGPVHKILMECYHWISKNLGSPIESFSTISKGKNKSFKIKVSRNWNIIYFTNIEYIGTVFFEHILF